jgi:hypothetical protein
MKKTLYVLACALFTLLVLPAAAQVPAYVPTDGLVGWWPFNGNANDESGNGNDGVVNGATLAEDRLGNSLEAYSFNGINDYITMPHSNSLNFGTSDLTLSLWFNLNDFNPDSPQFLISKERAFAPDGNQFRAAIEMSNNASNMKTYFTSAVNENGLQWSIENGYNLQFNNNTALSEWTHLIIVRQGVRFDIYKDNILQATDSSTTGFIHDYSENFQELIIGAESASFDTSKLAFFSGLIDDIAIYNRALTEQEIQSLYTGTTPPPCVSLPSNLQQGLVGYWPFCGNANDESGNGNDGVVNGATLTEDRFGNAGKAYSFNGTNNTIQIPTNTILEPSNELSVSIWLNPSGYGAGNFPHAIVKRLNPNSNTFGIVAGAGNSWACGIQTTNSGTAIYSEDDSFSNGQWILLTSTFDGNAHRLFVNGILTDSADVTGDIVYNSNYGWTLGYSTVFSQYFEGQLDDIGIWNRALTPEEVQELYTLDACTFTVYDTVTVYETVYDTVYTYETIYDTVTTYITVTDTLLIDITFTGIEGQPSWLNTVTVFPNPASDHITIDYGNFALMAGYNTVITDAAGATVYSSAVNSQQVSIDINAWGTTGVYYMSIYDANGVLVAVRQIVLE